MAPDFDPFADPTKTEEPVKPKEEEVKPDPAAEQQAAIDAANKRTADAEAKLEAQTKSYEQNLGRFTDILGDRYTQKSQQQEPEPGPALTDADHDKKPIETTRMVAKEEVTQALEQVGQHYGAVIGGMQEQLFDAQMENLRGERFYEYLKDDIREFFVQNPEGKVSPQAARTIYSQYVGQRVDELLKKEAAANEKKYEEQDQLVQRRVTRPDVRSESVLRSPAPRAPVAEPEAKLDKDAQRICDIFTYYGVFKDEKDWVNWEAKLRGSAREDIPQDLTIAGRAR